MNRRRMATWGWILMSAAFCLTLGCLPFVGMEKINPADIWQGTVGLDARLFWELRVPRVLIGMLVGGGLALAGLVFQAVFRNPLATPYTLGTAAGASLGATLAIALGWTTVIAGVSGVALFAFGGAWLSLLLIYLIAKLRQGMSTETMLLSGVAASFFFSSLILLIQYVSNQVHTLRIMRWLMGALDVVGYQPVLQLLPLLVISIVVLYLLRWELNLLATGEDLAASRGMQVERTKWILLLLCGILVGSMVSITGPIGFVGIMIPHVARLVYGQDHRRLVPAVLLIGAIFLPLCDALARILIAPAEMPVGIITALLGGPFFIWLLIRQARRK